MPDENQPQQFGTLVDVDLRQAWAHEAKNFTPWLAENLPRLSKAIAIELEPVATEVAVGGYSADILAVNPQDGTRVLIENQLEPGDHTHLGQMLTYLAGLEAKTVVWVARDFTEPHLSAIRWLNEHTAEPFSFLAVRVRSVRIGDSPIAPLFELVEKPNDWEREIREEARKRTEASPLHLKWQAFWTHYLGRHPETDAKAYKLSVRWTNVPGTTYQVSQFISGPAVGVYLRGDYGVPWNTTAEVFTPFAADLEAELGAPMGSGGQNIFFANRLNIDTNEQANWDQMADWLFAERNRYVEVAARILGAKS